MRGSAAPWDTACRPAIPRPRTPVLPRRPATRSCGSNACDNPQRSASPPSAQSIPCRLCSAEAWPLLPARSPGTSARHLMRQRSAAQCPPSSQGRWAEHLPVRAKHRAGAASAAPCRFWLRSPPAALPRVRAESRQYRQFRSSDNRCRGR